MNTEINYKSNPLHGVSLKAMLMELVDHYGFEILHAYLYINCFKTNPSIASSVKFLNKTDWARENVESFYLYEFKNLPRASAEQFLLPPRDRIVPDDQKPGEPAVLSLEDAERLREKRAKKSAGFRKGSGFSAARGQNNTQRPYKNAKKIDRKFSKENDKVSIKNTPKAPEPAQNADTSPWANWKTKSKTAD